MLSLIDIIRSQVLRMDMVNSYVEHGLLVDDVEQKDHGKDSIPEYVPPDCIKEWLGGTLRPTEKGLAVADTIIPSILKPVDDL